MALLFRRPLALPGKPADLAVLDRDLLKIRSPERKCSEPIWQANWFTRGDDDLDKVRLSAKHGGAERAFIPEGRLLPLPVGWEGGSGMAAPPSRTRCGGSP